MQPAFSYTFRLNTRSSSWFILPQLQSVYTYSLFSQEEREGREWRATDNCVCLCCTQTKHLSSLPHVLHHLRQLRVVRRSLTTDSAHSLIRALVHNRVDYCNGVLAGLPQTQINRLQSILRAAACLVLQLPGWASVSNPIRVQLHWLSIPQRIQFKLCSVVYRLQMSS